MAKPGTALRRWREKNDVTQVAVAAGIGVSQGAVSKFEANQRKLTELAAIRLEQVTGGAVLAVEAVMDSRRDGLAAILAELAKTSEARPTPPAVEVDP